MLQIHAIITVVENMKLLSRKIYCDFSRALIMLLVSAFFIISIVPTSAQNNDYVAFKMIQTSRDIQIQKGKALTFKVGFKNNGTKTWYSDGPQAMRLHTDNPFYRESKIRHKFWSSEYSLCYLGEDELSPGRIGYFTFAVQAPDEVGEFTEEFHLITQDGIYVEGGEFILKVNVLENDPVIPVSIQDNGQAATVAEPEQAKEEEAIIWADELIEEPIIRVGIYPTKEPVKITANKNFRILNYLGVVLNEMKAGQPCVVNFSFDTKIYELICPNMSEITTSYLRFEQVEPDTVFEILNYYDPPSWNKDLNDNKFRDVLEIRYSEDKNKLWVINEVPIETYLKGLAETSNATPIEYQKSILTAARTYAMYHYNLDYKHKTEYFTIDSYYDQMYRGYNSEIRMPNLVQAVEETRGVMITYENEVVVTPYFANSDGRTRSWEEVWGGPAKPWVQSKPDPWCAGKKLWGHGVGMSALGAYYMADEGSTFDEILNYYYTDIQLIRFYQ